MTFKITLMIINDVFSLPFQTTQNAEDSRTILSGEKR